MKEKKLSDIFFTIVGGAVAILIGGVILYGVILDAYTTIMGFTFKMCDFDEVYCFEADGQSFICSFEEDEMVMYIIDETHGTRISYTYRGTYYNKGFFNRFLTPDDEWVLIEGAEKAGEFSAKCKTCVVSDGIQLEIMDGEDIAERSEETGTDYSIDCYFKISGDTFWLIAPGDPEKDNGYSIPLEEARVLTGRAGEMVDHLDAMWENAFGDNS